MNSTSNRTASQPESGAWAPERTCRFREAGLALVAAVVLSAPILGIGGAAMVGEYRAAEAARQAEAARRLSLQRLLAGPALEVVPVAAAEHGRDVFLGTCVACHGADAKGVPGLGKDLTSSWFVASLDDAALRSFIAEGRPTTDRENTTRVPMPARGGREDLTDQDLGDVVVYLRGVQDSRRMPALGAPKALAVGPVTEQDKAAALAAAGGDEELAEYIAHGTKLFAGTCAACHGKDALGLKGNGKDLVHSEFCKSLDDDALLAFVKHGRDPGDPRNTTGVGMPSKGGNPALSDDDLMDVIAYLRSLQKGAAVGRAGVAREEGSRAGVEASVGESGNGRS